jgi:hypothetical protein
MRLNPKRISSNAIAKSHGIAEASPDNLNALGCPIDNLLTKVIAKLYAQETKIGWHNALGCPIAKVSATSWRPWTTSNPENTDSSDLAPSL